jgi:glycerate 2-kinase
METNAARRLALQIFEAGLAAADPFRLLTDRSRLEGNRWIWEGAPPWEIPAPGSRGRVIAAGAGKAVASLARALEQTLGPRLESGCIVVKHGHGLALEKIRVHEGGHPLPDRGGLAGTKALREELSGLAPEDRVFFLLTGGASALLVSPVEGVSLEDKIEVNRLLLASGATIQEMNAVRKHLSAVKGGRLAERIAPAQALTLIVSDVVGDDLSSIGSGPTAPDPTTFEESLAVISRYGLTAAIPAAARQHLERGASGEIGETPKPGHPVFQLMRHLILASNRQSLDAAAGKAGELGYPAEVFERDMVGSTHQKAGAFARRLREMARAGRPQTLLAGGETTLKVTGSGRGGRNQEFALVAAGEIAGETGLLVLAAGTDGTDGPTDAAGAFADPTTLSRARAAGLAPEALLANNDSYRLFDRLGDLLRTGPTGTNVMDLVVGLAYRPKA